MRRELRKRLVREKKGGDMRDDIGARNLITAGMTDTLMGGRGKLPSTNFGNTFPLFYSPVLSIEILRSLTR